MAEVWTEKHEAKLDELVKSLGLVNWEVVWVPDKEQEELGRAIPESRVILVFDRNPKAAMRTVIHEVIELKLRPAFQVQRDLSNALIELLNAQDYKMKERSIEGIVDVIFALVESDELKGILTSPS